MASLRPVIVRDLGNYIRDQRNGAQISVRQLARLAGVSNPYLSQIERGLRKPSAEILQQIAKALRISAEALYVQAGILDARDDDNDTTAAVLSDTSITERQKQVLLEIYDSFRTENEARAAASGVTDTLTADAPTETGRVGAAPLAGSSPAAAEAPAPRPARARRTAPDGAPAAARAARTAGAGKPPRRTATTPAAATDTTDTTDDATTPDPATTHRTADPGTAAADPQ